MIIAASNLFISSAPILSTCLGFERVCLHFPVLHQFKKVDYDSLKI